MYCCNLQQAHSSCHYMLPKECGFGYLQKLVLPPYAVSMPNTTLWSSCSQNRCRSATLNGELGVIYRSSSTSCFLLVENGLNFQLFLWARVNNRTPEMAGNQAYVETGAINPFRPSNLVFCHHLCFPPCLGSEIFSLLYDHSSPCLSWQVLFRVCLWFPMSLIVTM